MVLGKWFRSLGLLCSLLLILAVSLAASPPRTAHAQVYSAGYYMVSANGAVYHFGDALYYGSMAGQHLNAPIVGMAATPDGKGYWLVAADGGVFSFGDAQFYGSMGGKHLNAPIVGMAATPDGKGYWLVAADGGVFSFGDAQFYGSMGGKPLNKPVVGMAATPDGKGYWLVAADGGVFSFGNAQFYGSMGGKPLNKPVVGMATTPDGKGYWLVAADGGIFSFGDAQFYGSMGGKPLNKPVVGMASIPGGQGYWLVAQDGGLFSFGSAAFYGSVPAITVAPSPIVGMASVNYLTPPVLSVGWGYFNTGNAGPGGWSDLQQNYNQLSAIAPDWYGLVPEANNTFQIDGPAASETATVTSYAQSRQVAVWPSIGWPGPGSYVGGYGGDDPYDPLTSATEITQMATQIAHIAAANHYNGMTIDYEGMPVTDYQAFDSFIQQLSVMLHGQGQSLMVATYPTEYPNSAYDYAALGQYADYIDMMTYGNHVNLPHYWVGPNAGYPWVESYVNQALASVPASKLIVGLGPYGTAWTLSPSGVVGYNPEAGQDFVTNYWVSNTLMPSTPAIYKLFDPWQQELTFTDGPLAQAPAATLSTANDNSSLGSVMELQTLLQYILVRYAVANKQTTEPQALAEQPNGLMVTDGLYGSPTALAVAEFQQDFNVTGDPSGTYGPATAAALQQVINEYNIGQNIFWVENSASTSARMALVNTDHLAGFAPWRLGYESLGYWIGMSSVVNVSH